MYVRLYHLWALPAVVGLPIAAAFLIVGAPSSQPVRTAVAARTLVPTANLPVVAGGTVAKADPASTGQGSSSSRAYGAFQQRSGHGAFQQRSGSGNAAQIEVARAAAAANPSVRPPAATSTGGSSSHTTVTAAPAASSGAAGLSLGQSSHSRRSVSIGATTPLSGGSAPHPGSDYKVRSVTEPQPVAGSPTPQPAQAWVATPSDTSTSGSLAETLAAEGYNMDGIFSAADQPQLVPDYMFYIDEGLSPSYAYAADSVSTSEVAVFQHLGFTLMRDVDTGDQYWVGPELALDPEYAPVTSSS